MKRLVIFFIYTTLIMVSALQTGIADIPETVSYQGVLTNASGDPVADGNYNLTFRLYDAATDGSQLWTETHPSVAAVNGLFNVILGTNGSPLTPDFSVPYWLSIAVNDSELSPRIPLASSPYSLNTRNVADGSITTGKLDDSSVTSSKLANNSVTVNKIQPDVVSSLDGVSNDGGNVDIVPGANITVTSNDAANTITISSTDTTGNDWKLGGNAGASGSFLGTIDSVPLEFRVNNNRILRLEPHATSPNIIGGLSDNSVTSGVYGATIGGGGRDNDRANEVTDIFGTVGGGAKNMAGDAVGTAQDAHYATVAGGFQNNAGSEFSFLGGGMSNNATGAYSMIGGGESNTASAPYSTVSGGTSNTASDEYAAVGGGDTNTANGKYAIVGGGYNNQASNEVATIGGGGSNQAAGHAATVSGGGLNIASESYATVSGGSNNEATNYYTTIGGGLDNIASRDYGTVGGGYNNQASQELTTVSGGGNNQADGEKATVGGGNGNIASGFGATVSGGSSNQATGGYATVPGGYGNIAQGDNTLAAGQRALATHDGSTIFSDSLASVFNSIRNNEFAVRCTGGVRFYTNWGPNIGVYVLPGSSTWTSFSDRNIKDNFSQVDGRDTLEHLVSIPIETWNYKTQDPSIRHMGPMAQDFYAAFGLGADERHIGTVDADGVALAAIQGLYELVKEKEAENTELKQRIDNQEERLKALESLILSQKVLQ